MNSGRSGPNKSTISPILRNTATMISMNTTMNVCVVFRITERCPAEKRDQLAGSTGRELVKWISVESSGLFGPSLD